MIANLLAVLLTLPLAAVPATRPPTDADTWCEIIVEGQGVEDIQLQSEDDEKLGTTTPVFRKDSTFLAVAGRYRINGITVKGGYQHSATAGTRGEWFTLTPEKPYRLQAGAPLCPHVEVTRQGRLLQLDYQLLDSAGRSYTQEHRGYPGSKPHFIIRQGDREIASGDFEYG